VFIPKLGTDINVVDTILPVFMEINMYCMGDLFI
jgi:hypothetical protein